MIEGEHERMMLRNYAKMTHRATKESKDIFQHWLSEKIILLVLKRSMYFDICYTYI